MNADWLLIESDYRLGFKSLRQIASEHGLSDTAIRKRAKKDAWVRDLGSQIRAKADALVRNEAVLVRKDVVRSSVSANHISDADIVDANANIQKDIVLSHRKDINRLRKILTSQASELETASESLELTRRIKALKDLTDTLKSLIGAEREAHGIDVRFEEKEEKQVTFDITETARRVAFLLAQADTKNAEATAITTQQFTGIYHASRHEVSSGSNRRM